VLPQRKLLRSLRPALLLAAMILPFLPADTAAAHPAAAAPDDLHTIDVSFHSAGQTLHGTIVAPTGARGRPAMVLVAGAGSTDRNDYRPEAEAFARSGIVTLIYDKRADYSRATTSFQDLATDALAGVDLLRSRPETAASRVGLWGHSQGGWVVPLAAAGSGSVAFVVTVSASGLRPDRAQLWSNRMYLAHAGVDEDLIDPIGTHLSRMLINLGLFGDTGNDPVTNLTNVRQPLLGVFGDHDRSTVPGESLTIYRQALEHGGNGRYTLRVVHDADHDMRYSTDGFSAHNTRFAPGYVDLVTSWVNGLAAGAPAPSADPPPAQTLASRPVQPPAWYESPALQASSFILMLLAFAAYPIGAASRRLRGHRGSPPVRWAPRLLATAGPVVLLGTAGYLFFVVATGATTVDATVLGRPPWWLMLQLMAAVVVISTAITLIGAWRHRSTTPGRIRLGVLLAGGLIFVPWAAYWGLLTP
jgi:uncharacterized protein